MGQKRELPPAPRNWTPPHPPAGRTCEVELITPLFGGGVLRGVLKEAPGWAAFFGTAPNPGVPELQEAFADRATIERTSTTCKRSGGIGQQQVRHLGTHIGVFHLDLRLHPLVAR